MIEAARELLTDLSGGRFHVSNDRSLILEEHPATEKFFKPDGIWYSDDGWLNWCLDNWQCAVRRYIYEVKILDDSRILRINDKDAFETFEEQYLIPDNLGVGLDGNLYESKLPYRLNARKMFGRINWPKVMREYSGIEIFPYFWEKRLESIWYYSWDCASGCIWDFSVVQIRLFAYYDESTNSFIKVQDGSRYSANDPGTSPAKIARDS
jgi:hypothetical protein